MGEAICAQQLLKHWKKSTRAYARLSANMSKIQLIDNRSTSDNLIVNSTDMHITVACDQQQAGKFSINLLPGQQQRVASHITAQPYPQGKQKYDQFDYRLRISETWEVYFDSGALLMRVTSEK